MSSATAATATLSTLAEAADVALDCSVDKEACSLGLAPTASTTTMLALGDALAVSLSEKRGFKEEDFANLHPGGKLGKKLARVESLMHAGDAIPRVSAADQMSDVIYEMSRKKLGVTTVAENDRLLGVISDGDLRRLLELRGKDVLDLTAAECMTRDPRTIGPHEFAAYRPGPHGRKENHILSSSGRRESSLRRRASARSVGHRDAVERLCFLRGLCGCS